MKDVGKRLSDILENEPKENKIPSLWDVSSKKN